MPFVYNYLDSMVMAVMKNKRKIFRQQKTPAIKAGAYFKIFFNSRTREGCDISSQKVMRNFAISTHAPAMGATYAGDNTDVPTKFQLTHPRGVRRSVNRPSRRRRYFNSRTREGCDQNSKDASRNITISTHAPARGATTININENAAVIISTHAPARGATIDVKSDFYALQFQLTHPREVRLFRFESISNVNYFNSRTRERCDRI